MIKLTIRFANSDRTGTAYFAPEHIVAVIPNVLHEGESGIATSGALSFDVTEDPLTVALMVNNALGTVHS